MRYISVSTIDLLGPGQHWQNQQVLKCSLEKKENESSSIINLTDPSSPRWSGNLVCFNSRAGVCVRDVRGGAFSSGAGRAEDENPRGVPGRGGAKKRVNQLIQNFNRSALIVTRGFVLQYGVLIKENITFSDF